MKNTPTSLINARTSIKPKDHVTSPTNGVAVENGVKGHGDALITLRIGDVTGTTPTLDVKIQESADGSTGWTDVLDPSVPANANDAVFSQKTDANADSVFVGSINMEVRKKFLRAVITIGGTSTPTFGCVVTIDLLGDKKLPVAQEAAVEFSLGSRTVA